MFNGKNINLKLVLFCGLVVAIFAVSCVGSVSTKSYELKIPEEFKSAVKYHRDGQVLIAEQLYRKVLEKRPDFADAHGNLGVALQAQGRLEEAAVCSRRAIEINPNYAEAHMNLGNVFEAQGYLEEAAACYLKTLSINPNYAETHALKGVLLQFLSKIETNKNIRLAAEKEAKNSLLKGIKINGNLKTLFSRFLQKKR